MSAAERNIAAIRQLSWLLQNPRSIHFDKCLIHSDNERLDGLPAVGVTPAERLHQRLIRCDRP